MKKRVVVTFLLTLIAVLLVALNLRAMIQLEYPPFTQTELTSSEVKEVQDFLDFIDKKNIHQ